MIYRLIYIPRSIVAGDKIEYAGSVWRKGRGLIGHRPLLKGAGLWLPGVGSIHTFGIRGPIDVLFLDREFRSTFALSKLKSGRVFVAPAGSRHCIELAPGTLTAEQLASTPSQWLLEPVA